MVRFTASAPQSCAVKDARGSRFLTQEEGVTFPSNFRDIGYISFAKDQLEAKAMDVLKELIGFGIVKVST